MTRDKSIHESSYRRKEKQKTAVLRLSLHVGSGTWIRTMTDGFKGRCPTIRRSPNIKADYRIHLYHSAKPQTKNEIVHARAAFAAREVLCQLTLHPLDDPRITLPKLNGPKYRRQVICHLPALEKVARWHSVQSKIVHRT